MGERSEYRGCGGGGRRAVQSEDRAARLVQAGICFHFAAASSPHIEGGSLD